MARSKAKPPKLKVFIGSTTEGKDVARLIAEELGHEFNCLLWTSFFEPAKFNLESLELALSTCPCAIFVMSPDDSSIIRGKKYSTPRDNLLFELGLFAGRYGRQATFMMTPRDERPLLPNDLQGVTTAEYEVLSSEDPIPFNVSGACNKIARGIRASQLAKTKPLASEAQTGKFWHGLSDTIRIVYGVEAVGGAGAKGHPKVSLRDLATAHLIFGFLNRLYPHKIISLIPSITREWKTLPTNEDLIFVGGFVTNEMFGYLHLQSRFESNDRFVVKLGRICGVEGRGDNDKRVLHPQFDGSRFPPPSRKDPQSIEDFPSEETRRDYGRVLSARVDIYGGLRRVITFAGIKGHGTQGAAKALTRDADVNQILRSNLSDDDRLEIIVASDVKDDVVMNTTVVELVLNGKRVFMNKENSWENCEQTNPCSKCTFGIPQQHLPIGLQRTNYEAAATQLKAIIFDLDDTLVDTFGCFIVPLELAAARKMYAKGLGKSVEDVLETLLRLRMTNPDNMREMIPEEFLSSRKEKVDEALKQWKSVNSPNMSLARLKELGGKVNQYRIASGVDLMLRELSSKYDLFLLTVGSPGFQNEKIDHLKIRDIFGTQILIIDAKTNETKQSKMLEVINKRGYQANSVVVVGNRLEHEIRAGIQLGLTTVWLRKGEGSAVQPGNSSGQPDRTIEDITELDQCLSSLEASMAAQLEQKRMGLIT